MPISVVMSVYNGSEYLCSAIDSILDQTFEDFEFIIVNDGSTDRSAEIVKRYNDKRIIFLQEATNRGLPVALNLGIKHSKGKYIARIDADDISLPSRLELQYKFLEKYPHCVAVGSNAYVTDKNGKTIFLSNNHTQWVDIKSSLPITPFYHSSVMFRKKIAERCGFYHADFMVMQDIVLFNKLAKYGELRNLAEPLIKYRLTETAICRRNRRDSKKIWKIIYKALNNDEISMRDKKILISIQSKRRISYRRSNYYLLIGKKYLWTNYNPKISQRNLILSIKSKPPNFEAWLYLLVSLFPKGAILILYRTLKKAI